MGEMGRANPLGLDAMLLPQCWNPPYKLTEATVVNIYGDLIFSLERCSVKFDRHRCQRTPPAAKTGWPFFCIFFHLSLSFCFCSLLTPCPTWYAVCLRVHLISAWNCLIKHGNSQGIATPSCSLMSSFLSPLLLLPRDERRYVGGECGRGRGLTLRGSVKWMEYGLSPSQSKQQSALATNCYCFPPEQSDFCQASGTGTGTERIYRVLVVPVVARR